MTSEVEIKGKLHFDPRSISKKHASQSTWKHVALVLFDDDSDDYYSWFIRKRYNLHLNKPMRGFHFTVINDKITTLTEEEIQERKKLFQGSEISIKYSTDIRTNGEHWWLKAFSEDAQNIRRAFDLSPDPFWSFHLTVGYVSEGNPDKQGNTFNQMWDHSHYLHQLLKDNKIS